MGAKIAAFISMLIILSGCANVNASIDKAIKLRNEIEQSNGCAFVATVTADYGEKIYVFSMDCTTDKEGNLSFTVIAPETISGIAGTISDAGGSLKFDDKVLAFQTMADGLLTPVTAPWILINTLKCGYIKGCTEDENGFDISADDSYADNAMHLLIKVRNQLPVSGEIFWNGRRLLTITVEGFRFL